ncbi:MAG: DUF2335 domain-containing protein [Candidatus Hydrogenedentota bacterium]
MTSGRRSKKKRHQEIETHAGENQSAEKSESTSQDPRQLSQRSLGIIQQYHYQGPLPPAKALREYGDIDPSFPERCIRMAEQEQQHRHDIQRKKVDAEVASIRRGQLGAIVLGLVALIAAVPVAIWSNAAAGVFVALFGMVSVMARVLMGMRADRPEKDEEEESSEQNDA